MTAARSSIARGNRLYPLSYALASMRSYPFRALSLAITLSLGVSLVGAVLIWADTGIQVSVNTYFDDSPFQMYVEEPNVDFSQVSQFLQSSDLIDSTYKVRSTVGLAYGTYLSDSVKYGLDTPAYSEGIKDCQVFFVDDDFLDVAQSAFSVEGRFALAPGEVLVSTQFIEYAHDVFGIPLTLNSSLDVELLTRAPIVGQDPLDHLGRVSIRDLRIVGIYEIEGYNSLLEEAYPSIMRSNYDYINFDQPVLGIRDSIMIRSDAVASDVLSTIDETGFFPTGLFVRASGKGLIAAGPDKIADNLLTLKARVEQMYNAEVLGLSEIMFLQNVVDTYVNTMPLISLNLPLFILALFLSVFAADTFMSARKGEVSALRSKGASSAQIYTIFITEAVVMAILSIAIGLFLSIVFSALIPSATSFLTFDWTTYDFYIANVVIRPLSIFYTLVFCIVPPLLFIIGSARRATRTEIGSLLVESSESIGEGGEARGFTIGISLGLLVMVVVSAVFFAPHPILLTMELGFGTISWFFIAYNSSHVLRRAFARLTARFAFLLGEKTQIAAGNLRMRKGRIVPLMVVLALTLSSTVAFPVQADTYQADLHKEVRYSIGADLRVSTLQKPFSFNATIESYPGVNDAMAVLQTYAHFGIDTISIEAVDPMEYLKIAYFDATSFNGEDPEEVLTRLVTTENGILLSQYQADRWNRTVGDTINLEIGARSGTVVVTFEIVGIVHSAPGFGYAAATEIPPSRVGAGFGYQLPDGFGLANIDYVSQETDILTTDLFLADLVCITDQDMLLRALNDLSGVTAVTPDEFDLTEHSFATALFLSTVEGLFSIGFVLSLILSMFSLTLFLGSIVRERRRDYAILRAVGASRQQVIRTVLSEFTGIILASLTLSLILGTVFGFIMSVIIFSMSPFSRVLTPSMVFPIGFLTIVVIFELAFMIIGSYFPAREASKTDPAIVLRNL